MKGKMKRAFLILAFVLAFASVPSASASASASFALSSKAVSPGLHKKNGHIVYVLKDGTLFKNGKKVVKGYVHVFDENGWRIRKYKYYKPGWVLKDGKYFWRQDNGKIVKKTGLFKPTPTSKYIYYLDEDYSRASGLRTVKGKIYYFVSNGKRYTRSGWKTISGKRYYFSRAYRALTGVHKLDGNLYLFGSDGSIRKNVKSYTYKGQEYQTDSKGVMTLVPQKPQESASSLYCRELTQRYMSQHTSSDQSNYDKLRSCFFYLLAYQNFFVYPDYYYDLSNPDWRYDFAIDLLERGDLGGDCYGFACVVASCARELGYEPYVHVAAEDHCFVSINGLYYDNSGGGIFGGDYPSGDYTITHIVKF